MSVIPIFETVSCRWIDISPLTNEKLHFLEETYGINPLLLEDAQEPNHLPKYEKVEDIHFFLTREIVDYQKQNLNTISDISTKLSIFIVGKNIISVHRTKSKNVEDVRLQLQQSPEEYKNTTPSELALLLALKVMKSFDDESKRLIDILDRIETDIFLKEEMNYNPIKRLYKIKRKAGLGSRILSISSEWITAFKKLDLEEVQVIDLIDKQKDVIADFEHLNTQVTNLISMYLALSDQKANQVMKLLAMYSVYFLPITFIAGIYGMNFEFMPELTHKFGYFITLSVMGIIVLATFFYFKRKRY